MTARRPLGLAAAAVLTVSVFEGCAPRRLTLPTGPGEPLADAQPVLAEAAAHCRDLRTLTAEAGLSGRAGGHRVRGRLIAGLAVPASLRLEAVAPFGPPVFILASSPERTILLLPREERVLTGQPPAAILEALAGVSVDAGDLLHLLAGCPTGELDGPVRQIGREWVVADFAQGTAYLRQEAGTWRVVAVRIPSLVAEFHDRLGDQPARVQLRSAGAEPGSAFDLILRLSQVERNAAVPAEAFTLIVPPDAAPLTLDELRRAGPMRDAESARQPAGSP